MEKITVQTAADCYLCTSCGICKNVCPRSCISYERKDGMYFPMIDRDKCIKCGICADVCPGLSIDYSRDGKSVSLSEAVTGDCLEQFTAWSRNEELRHIGGSGGVVMTIVRHLLDIGEYDGAFCVTDYCYSSQVKTELVTADDAEKLQNSSKSRYVPISHENLINYVKDNRCSSIIVVATPCALSGFIKAAEKLKLNIDNYLLLGLFCEGTFTYNIYDYFATEKFCKNKKLSSFHFKNKESGGWTGNMKLFYDDGSFEYYPASERTSMKQYFWCERCLYCIDKLNVKADISFGDNYTGENASSLGSNSVIVRTEKGKRCIELCRGMIETAPSTLEKICKAQQVDVREKNYYLSLEKRNGINTGIADTDGESVNNYRILIKRLNSTRQFREKPEKFYNRLKKDKALLRTDRILALPRRAAGKLKRLIIKDRH